TPAWARGGRGPAAGGATGPAHGAGGDGGGGRVLRREGERRGARAGRGGARHGGDHRRNAAVGDGDVRGRGPWCADAEGRARAGAALPGRPAERGAQPAGRRGGTPGALCWPRGRGGDARRALGGGTGGRGGDAAGPRRRGEPG